MSLLASSLFKPVTLYPRSLRRVAPLSGFPVRSVLWFQGEADAAKEATTANYYECRLLALIPQVGAGARMRMDASET